MSRESEFLLGMRRLVSSVCLVTTLDGDQRHGMIATAVSSVTASPPSLLVCINRNSSMHGPLSRSMLFSINVLNLSDTEVSRQFSNSDLRHLRFSSGKWTQLTTGAPVLLDAAASFDCRVKEFVEAETHSIVIGSVEAVKLGGENLPLAYLDGKYGTFHAEPMAGSRIKRGV